MKTPSYPVGLPAALLAGLLALATPAFVPVAFAQLRPAQPVQPDFDHRSPAANASRDFAPRQIGGARLQSQLPSVAVDFDPLLGSPKFVRDLHGFLTGPNGVGKAVSAEAARAIPAADPYRSVKAFLNEHSALFGHGAEVFTHAKITRESVGPHNGLRTVVWQQQLEGIPLFESVLIANITKPGELATLASQFLPDPAQLAASIPNRASLAAAPPLSATDALLQAAANLGENWTAADLQPLEGTVGDGYLTFKTPRPAYARKVWLPLDHSRLSLCWEVILDLRQKPERYLLLIDAQSGQPVLRRCLSHPISDATYNVFTSDSPSPFSPGWPTPSLNQPPLTNRVSVTIAALSTTGSPNGWIDDGNNTTTGNNADAFVDRDFDGQPDGPRPQGNPTRVFDFPQDLTQDPLTYSNASTVQLFYWCNWYHDRLYDLGFTEAAGNFQENNFGRGGLGNDSITCFVQAGADVGIADNSMFGTGPDGIHGECYMFIFSGTNPDRDGSLDTDVVLHEMTHGTSQRLVGGGVLMSALQSDGMGEGWSDFYALSLQSQAGDDVNGCYASGGYVTYQFVGLSLPNYYFGIRHFPYSTDMAKNPFTFKDIDRAQISSHAGVPRSPLYPFDPREADEVHHSGEVWCMTLWEVRANLITKFGYPGNQLMLQLVTDGMKLCPVNPNFLQSRDAILLADRINNGGANQGEIWRGFAKRGMGVSASSPDSSTTAGVVEAFDAPGLQIDHTLILGGNGNGAIEPNECNDLQIFLANNGLLVTNVAGFLSTTTPGVIIAQNASAYADFPPGATNANLTPFKISTSPAFICGTPIDFTFLVKAGGLGTTTNSFRLLTGLPGLPLRFDSTNAPLTIPDANPAGVYSSVLVSGIPAALSKVTVSLFLTHTYDSDLVLELISPDGTTNTLSLQQRHLRPKLRPQLADARTTFDDAAPVAISAGIPPWAGSFRPDQPLSIFTGKSGTNVNGTWLLHLVDQYSPDSGILQCWSLNVTPALCTEGGGECPGSDLALGMTAMPEPVFVSNSLAFSISVTNIGPSSAKAVTVSQLLPAGFAFVSASSSQGSCSQAGGVLTAKLGGMLGGAKATISVLTVPATPGTFSFTATASSEQPDFNPLNNSATVTSHVYPQAADLAVTIANAPPNPLAGSVFSYNIEVLNNGPSTANNVVVTNILPPSVSILSTSSSRGSISIVGNVVRCSFGTLQPTARATATFQVRPTLQGLITATAIAAATQNDPLLGNNVASVSTAVGPAADLLLSGVALPNPVVQQGLLTYRLTISNQGPSTASSLILNGTLPGSITVNSNFASQGSLSISGTDLSGDLGSLPGGASASVFLYTTPTASGPDNETILASFIVAAAQADTNAANNSLTLSTVVAPPFVRIIPAGALLTAESFSPPNGAIDIGETVTSRLFLLNVGNFRTTNLVATLLATNGVTPIPPASRTYGVLFPGGFAAGQFFGFTAAGRHQRFCRCLAPPPGCRRLFYQRQLYLCSATARCCL